MNHLSRFCEEIPERRCFCDDRWMQMQQYIVMLMTCLELNHLSREWWNIPSQIFWPLMTLPSGVQCHMGATELHYLVFDQICWLHWPGRSQSVFQSSEQCKMHSVQYRTMLAEVFAMWQGGRSYGPFQWVHQVGTAYDTEIWYTASLIGEESCLPL